jgi:hypothetical protein
MTASETIAALPAKSARASPPPPPPTSEAPGDADGPQDGGGQAPPASAPPTAPPGSHGEAPDVGDVGESEPSKNKRPGSARGKESTTAKLPGASEGQPVPQSEPVDAKTGGPPDLPDRVGFKSDDEAMTEIDLPEALKAEREALAACAGHGATVKVHVVRGEIVKIEVSDGKKCSLAVKKLPLGDGILHMEVK